jgi:hypothetical protein
MGVRLSYCVNDEVVKLILSPLPDRDPEKTFNRSKKGQLLYFGAVGRGECRVSRVEWSDESEGVGFRCQFSERGCRVSGVGFQEKPLNLKPEH